MKIQYDSDQRADAKAKNEALFCIDLDSRHCKEHKTRITMSGPLNEEARERVANLITWLAEQQPD